MKATVKEWLVSGTVDVFIGYRMMVGHPLPHCFVRERLAEVDELVVSPARYSLEKIATHMTAARPDIKIGLLARDCNQRAVHVLAIWNQLQPENVRTLPVNCCPSSLKDHGDCSYLEPEPTGEWKRKVGIENNLQPENADTWGREERLGRWMAEFQKCIKCYGCRNICPVCFCKSCSLEDGELVGTGTLPPEVPIFHLVRAVHMAGRCVDCGLCEDACPVDIPLRLLYRKVNEIVGDVFDYRAGTSTDQPPFSILGDKNVLTPKPIRIEDPQSVN